MVNINYQAFGTKGFQLRLRLYKDGETKYVVVTNKLKPLIHRPRMCRIRLNLRKFSYIYNSWSFKSLLFP